MLSFRSLALLLGLPLLAHATKPEHAVWQSYSDLAAGKCRSTSLTEDGVLSAAPATAKLADLGVEEAWSILTEPKEMILVGTAPEGKLLQVGADGSVKLVAKFNESHLYALAAGAHGEIYVGTSPDGKVYRVGAEGKTEVYFDPGEKYIWALAVAPDGSLYVGTGTKGKIYRVTAKGLGQVWYASDETHIRALAFDKSGALLAGSAESGYLYRIPARDQAVVLAGTGREEVNQIEARPDGMIYFTATGAGKESTTASLKKPSTGDDASGDDAKGVSALYRLNAELSPEMVWPTKETVLSLAWSEQEGGALLGTASDGYIYAVAPHGEATRLCKIESDSVTAMAALGGDTIVATSNPGRLFRISHEKTAPGIYESDVVDSESFARWGAVTLDASDPGAVKILTRSGNTAQPDKTWYPWTEATGGQPQSAAARYLQVQLQIGSGTVDRIDACYLPKNRPPHLDAVKILPVGIGYVPAPSSPLPPLPQSAAQLLTDADAAEAKTPMRYQSENAHGLRTLIWKASDPNGDDLTYNVSWRKKGETDWHDLAKNMSENLLTWDTSSWSEGRYELKVEASDAEANAPGEGLTDMAISREMIVNNTPPVIEIISQKSDAVEFTVKDELGGLQSVTVSTDGKSYSPLVPVDGILDSGSERFLARIAPGQTLFIRAEDGGGNVAGAQTGR
jgi:sugar lactone lactonase YvrE